MVEVKRIAAAVAFLFFFPAVLGENYEIRFMGSEFPPGFYVSDCVRIGYSIYCVGSLGTERSVWKYVPENDTLAKIAVLSIPYLRDACVARANSIYCIVGSGGLFVFDISTNYSRVYYQPFHGWTACNGSGYADADYIGGKCFVADSTSTYNSNYGFFCYGGKVWAYNNYHDVCDLLFLLLNNT